MLRLCLALLALAALSACAGGQQGPLPPDQAQRVAYRDDGPPSLTLLTMLNTRTGKGAHSSLLINGSQRVLFDPAGSFRVDWLTEYGDVLYGITDRKFAAYLSAHARQTHYVVRQEILVSPEVAERALKLAEARGNVSSAFCANSTSGILGQLPGFSMVQSTFYPEKLMRNFDAVPGVTRSEYRENDAGDIIDGVAAANRLQPDG